MEGRVYEKVRVCMGRDCVIIFLIIFSRSPIPDNRNTKSLMVVTTVVIGYNTTAIRLSIGTNLRATNSELETAKALGKISPKKRVTAVKMAVINPNETFGNTSDAVATNNAVL